MFATVGQQDAQLFAAVARTAELRLGEFNTQGRANMAWAFATVGHLDVALFTALAKEATQCLDEMLAHNNPRTSDSEWLPEMLQEPGGASFRDVADPATELWEYLKDHHPLRMSLSTSG